MVGIARRRCILSISNPAGRRHDSQPKLHPYLDSSSIFTSRIYSIWLRIHGCVHTAIYSRVLYILILYCCWACIQFDISSRAILPPFMRKKTAASELNYKKKWLGLYRRYGYTVSYYTAIYCNTILHFTAILYRNMLQYYAASNKSNSGIASYGLYQRSKLEGFFNCSPNHIQHATGIAIWMLIGWG